MQIEKYLKEKQPVIYKTFVNSIQNNRLSHAFLLIGSTGAPLLEIAKYLGKSLICDSPNPLACEKCSTCLRVDNNNYPDFIIINASLGDIKKEEIVDLEEKFSKEALEEKNKIYIINIVENLSNKSTNSMLKFLEEPKDNIFAFLTTNNEYAILPTIVSRCQKLYIKNQNRNDVISEAEKLGISNEDAELLSYFYNDAGLIYDYIQKEKKMKNSFFDLKKLIIDFLNEIIQKDKKAGLFYFQKNIIPEIKTKEKCRLLLDIFITFFEDVLSLQNQKAIFLKSYDKILLELGKKLPNSKVTLAKLIKQKNLINLNIIISLLLDDLILDMLGD